MPGVIVSVKVPLDGITDPVKLGASGTVAGVPFTAAESLPVPTSLIERNLT